MKIALKKNINNFRIFFGEKHLISKTIDSLKPIALNLMVYYRSKILLDVT